MNSAATTTFQRRKNNSTKQPTALVSHRKRERADDKIKKTKTNRPEHAEEERLTALLFGGGSGIRSGAPASSTAEPESHNDSDDYDDGEDVLFEIDRTGAEHEEDDNDDNNTEDEPRDSKGRRKKTKNASSDAFAKALAVNNNNNSSGESAAAWIDEEDANTTVNLLETHRLRKLRTSRAEAAASALNGVELERRMRERYETTMGRTTRTDWADLGSNENDNDIDNDDTALQGSSVPLLRHGPGKRRLEPHTLDIVRCPDANATDPNLSVVRSVEFHPGSDPDRPLLLTAGFDKTLRFFQVSETGSTKLHGIHFPNFPIYSASFLGSSGNVLCSSRRKHFYIYNSEAGKLDHVPNIVGREEKSLECFAASPDGRTVAFCGNDGFCILYDTHHQQWIANVKLSGSVRALAFSPDGDSLWASGTDGDVYRWNVTNAMPSCVERFSNQDGTACVALAVSSNQHLAVGAQSGVVNLYDTTASNTHHSSSQQPDDPPSRTPLKSILNLQTSISTCRFNDDGQILAMATHMEQRGLKLMHVPTCTVFANWPAATTPLGYVSAMDFSPGSQFAAMGNDKGKCLLYQLKHYS